MTSEGGSPDREAGPAVTEGDSWSDGLPLLPPCDSGSDDENSVAIHIEGLLLLLLPPPAGAASKYLKGTWIVPPVEGGEPRPHAFRSVIILGQTQMSISGRMACMAVGREAPDLLPICCIEESGICFYCRAERRDGAVGHDEGGVGGIRRQQEGSRNKGPCRGGRV